MVDQLVEQNRRLEQQNQELMKEINKLSQALQAQAGQSQQTEAQTSPAEPDRAVVNAQQLAKETATSSSKDQSSEALEASEGNSAIFGEFNPGKGFTVAKSANGELNLQTGFGTYPVAPELKARLLANPKLVRVNSR